MPGITLEIAQKHLDAWLEAELACTTNQSSRKLKITENEKYTL